MSVVFAKQNMRSIKPLVLIFFGLCVVPIAALASGGPPMVEGGFVTVKSGVASKIKGFGYCDKPAYSTVSGFAEHGKISSNEVKGKVCGKTDFPITQVIYTSEAGFVGVDHLVVYINDRSLAITVTVVK